MKTEATLAPQHVAQPHTQQQPQVIVQHQQPNFTARAASVTPQVVVVHGPTHLNAGCCHCWVAPKWCGCCDVRASLVTTVVFASFAFAFSLATLILGWTWDSLALIVSPFPGIFGVPISLISVIIAGGRAGCCLNCVSCCSCCSGGKCCFSDHLTGRCGFAWMILSIILLIPGIPIAANSGWVCLVAGLYSESNSRTSQGFANTCAGLGTVVFIGCTFALLSSILFLVYVIVRPRANAQTQQVFNRQVELAAYPVASLPVAQPHSVVVAQTA